MNWKLILAVMGGLLMAQDAKPPVKPPTIEELQKQVAEKDAQIAQLQQQIQYMTGKAAAIGKLFGACADHLSADEAQLAAKK